MVTVLRRGGYTVLLLASFILALHSAPVLASTPHFSPMTPITMHLYPNIGYPGSCVWYALHERPDIPPVPVPYAYQLARALANKYPGYHQGTTPQHYALAVFAPGVQGANKVAGHIALVIAVAGDRKTFQVAQMSSPTAWVVSYAWDKAGAGVSFIY